MPNLGSPFPAVHVAHLSAHDRQAVVQASLSVLQGGWHLWPGIWSCFGHALEAPLFLRDYKGTLGEAQI